MDIEKVKNEIFTNLKESQLYHVYTPIVINGQLIIDGNRRKLANQKFRLEKFPDFKNQSILDIGCNAGFILFELKRKGAGKCLGIDNNKNFIRIARYITEYEKLKDIEFIARDALKLKYSKE